MNNKIILNGLISILLLIITQSQAMIPNPIISRGKPIYGSTANISYLVDGKFGTSFLTVGDNSWVAINVGEGPSKVLLNWNNPSYSWSDTISAATSCKQGMSFPVNYTIQTSSNSTNGTDGQWTTAATITNNVVTARGHIIDFTGASWVKMNITKGGGQIDEIEVFDVSNGKEDTWFFPGTSISANAFKGSVPSENFSDLVTKKHSGFNPAIVRGGIGCINSTTFANDISKYLNVMRYVHYWAIEMGTNDAWGGTNDGVPTFKTNMQKVIDSCKAAGIEPIIARMIGTNTAKTDKGWQVHPDYLKAIDSLTVKNHLIPGPDFYTWFSTHPNDLNPDGVHPNESGAAKMQAMWAEKIDSLYQGTSVISRRTAVVSSIKHNVSLFKKNNMVMIRVPCAGSVKVFLTNGKMIMKRQFFIAGSYPLNGSKGFFVIKFNSERGEEVVKGVSG